MPTVRSGIRQALALLIGLIGALAAVRIGVPLPWMLGSMMMVTAAALMSPPIEAPVELRKIMLPVLGVMLGSGFHPGLFDHLASWAIVLALLPVYMVLAFGLSFWVYRRLGRYDPVTAYFSAAPGGLNDMMMIGAEAGGIERRIALAHASRILIVVCFVSLSFGFLLDIGGANSARPYVRLADIPGFDLGLLALCAVVGAIVAPRLRLPAPQLLGPMILSALTHATGMTSAPPPTALVNTAQLVIGTVIGCRFVGVPAREILNDLGLAGLASTGMLLATFAGALAAASLGGAPIAEVFLAYSPGGLPEMSLLALAMGADVAFVATLHLLRITIVIVAAPLIFRWTGLKRD